MVIFLEDVWKRYGLWPVIRDCWQNFWKKEDCSLKEDDDWALREINLKLDQGETLGIIGRNGAGKSTILKILAGVTPITCGQFKVFGRIFPMIELNAGLHKELTGRENVYLLGAIMGLSRREVQLKMPEVEKFCELGVFFDRPVRTYSSGMMARLGFAVAVNVDADILLVDEVLAVGDFAFQKKCLDRMNSLINQGMSMILVSHNPYLIERMCNRAILLNQGTVMQQGDPKEVAKAYFDLVNQSVVDNLELARQTFSTRAGSGQLRIIEVEVLNKDGNNTDVVYTTYPVTFRLHMRVYESVIEPSIGIRVFNANNDMVACFSTAFDRKGIVFEDSCYVDCYVHSFDFMPNLYYLQIKISTGVTVDMVENAVTFRVNASSDIVMKTGNKGIAFSDANWSFHAATQFDT